MKTKKTNHSEKVNELLPIVEDLRKQYDDAGRAWYYAHKNNASNAAELREIEKSIKAELDVREEELKFHQIMAQEKKYATEWLYSDAHAYEIIEEKSDTTLVVRRLKATIKPEAKKALHESFVPGGFCGHFENSLQEWDFESDENGFTLIIRRSKKGNWLSNGRRFTIEAEPVEVFDYNF